MKSEWRFEVDLEDGAGSGQDLVNFDSFLD